MTDMREALEAMLARFELYLGPNGIHAGQHDKELVEKARAALAAPGEPVAWRWRPLGATEWIYNPTPEWLAEHRHEIECEPLYASLRALDVSPDDIRKLGWSVAVHNDYRLNGLKFTFWLFTKDGMAVKGEGRTDAEALEQVRAAISNMGK